MEFPMLKLMVQVANKGLLQQTCWKSWPPHANHADQVMDVSQ
jgi:hypothetical protein